MTSKDKKNKGAKAGKGRTDERRRAAADRVRHRARERQRERQGTSTLSVDGDLWKARKKCTISILPYTVKMKDHPDGVAPGEEWFRLPYKTHSGIGPENKQVVCPSSFGKPCPICEEVARLSRDYKKNEDYIRDIRAKDREIYNVYDHKSGEVQVWDISYHLFSKYLDQWLDDGDELWGGFYLPDEDGFDLKCIFEEKSFQKNTFYQISRVDFVERSEPLDSEILGEAQCLDDLPKILSYKELEKIFFEIPDDDADDDDEEDEPIPRRRKKAEPEPEEDDEEEDIDEEEPPARSSRKKKPEPEDDEDDDEDDDEEPTPRRGRDRKKTPEPEDDDEDAAAVPKKGSAKKSSASGSKKNSKCPFGHTFGADCDEHDDCDDCDSWQDCADYGDTL